MGEPLDTEDFLTAALRESRGAVPDAGFSLRVTQRALAEQRRVKWARLLPVIMAFFGVALAFAVTGFTALRLGSQMPRALGSLAETAQGMLPSLDFFAHTYFGLQPWMILAAIGAMACALFSASRDPRAAFRF